MGITLQLPLSGGKGAKMDTELEVTLYQYEEQSYGDAMLGKLCRSPDCAATMLFRSASCMEPVELHARSINQLFPIPQTLFIRYEGRFSILFRNADEMHCFLGYFICQCYGTEAPLSFRLGSKRGPASTTVAKHIFVTIHVVDLTLQPTLNWNDFSTTAMKMYRACIQLEGEDGYTPYLSDMQVGDIKYLVVQHQKSSEEPPRSFANACKLIDQHRYMCRIEGVTLGNRIHRLRSLSLDRAHSDPKSRSRSPPSCQLPVLAPIDLLSAKVLKLIHYLDNCYKLSFSRRVKDFASHVYANICQELEMATADQPTDYISAGKVKTLIQEEIRKSLSLCVDPIIDSVSSSQPSTYYSISAILQEIHQYIEELQAAEVMCNEFTSKFCALQMEMELKLFHIKGYQKALKSWQARLRGYVNTENRSCRRQSLAMPNGQEGRATSPSEERSGDGSVSPFSPRFHSERHLSIPFLRNPLPLTEGSLVDNEAEWKRAPERKSLDGLLGASTNGPSDARPSSVRNLVPKKAPEWIPDYMVSKCHSCEAMFNVARRKHHCRACGNIFCSYCAGRKAPIPSIGIKNKVRVCEVCYLMLHRPTSV